MTAIPRSPISQQNPERPKPRPGFHVTWIQWGPDGRVIHAKWERVAKSAPEQFAESAKIPANAPIKRGIVAVAKPHQGELL